MHRLRRDNPEADLRAVLARRLAWRAIRPVVERAYSATVGVAWVSTNLKALFSVRLWSCLKLI